MEFDEAIIHFNKMYGLPTSEVPTLAEQPDPLARMKNFLHILREELDEGEDIIAKMESGADELDILVDLADWLGDIQVYCASEMERYGLPLNIVLNTIMQSNFSKLGADGKPIYDSRGKVQKGPLYWRPEPKLKEILSSYRKD